tara:strand:+ start:928 stop:1041 length:114 start_codon:yes stop_codon:yes gene_type:complete
MNWTTIKANLANKIAKKTTHTQKEEYDKKKSLELLRE